MAPIGENTVVGFELRTLIAFIVLLSSIIGTFFGTRYLIQTKYDKIMVEVEAAKELPRPGTGIYVVDLSDPAAAGT